MTVTNTELRKVITKLDDVKMELLRLRAELLPEERPTSSERKQINQGRREIARRQYVTLSQLKKELGV
jgi:ribosomal protein L29